MALHGAGCLLPRFFARHAVSNNNSRFRFAVIERSRMKFIRVDMTTQQISVSPVPEQYRDLGGRGLTSGFLAAEVDPNCHALGRGNKLVIAPGLLTGSTAP